MVLVVCVKIEKMKVKILVVGIVRKGNKILLRKKPKGSPPYKETWYLFGGELVGVSTPEKAIQSQLEKQAGIKIKMIKQLSWDTEVKKDRDGERKLFVYLDCMCEYVSGKLQPAKGIERLEWVNIKELSKYDHVPPSRKLLKKLGYL